MTRISGGTGAWMILSELSSLSYHTASLTRDLFFLLFSTGQSASTNVYVNECSFIFIYETLQQLSVPQLLMEYF